MGVDVKILLKTFGVVLVLSTALAWWFFGEGIALAVGLGFITMATNTWLTRRTVRQFTSGARSTLVGLYVVKMVVLFGILYALLTVVELNVIGLVVGLSLPMVIMIFAGNRWMAMEESSVNVDDDISTAQTVV